MGRNNPMVSIIMPVYNVDRYVARAVESIQHQNLRDFELLIVDDGSTDRSGDVCDRLAERDIRIDVFHTPNGGAPAARNFALERARGKYVYFVDADDWAEPDMLTDMVNAAEKNNAELVVAGFYIDTYYGSGQEHLTELKAVPNAQLDQAAFRSYAWQLFDTNLLYTPWNKLFLRARIEQEHIRFKPTFWDDFPFVLDYIRDVSHVSVLSRAYYHFIRQRAESETARWRPDMYQKREEEDGWMRDLYAHWGLTADAASNEMVCRRYVERLVGCIENVCNPQSTLSRAEKIKSIEVMISTERAQEAVRVARPRSRMMALLLGPIRSKNARLAYAQGRFISFVRRHNTKLFASLKARR